MKITESITRPASLFEKEVRRIDYTQVTEADFPELQHALWNLLTPVKRRTCILWVQVGNSNDVWLKTQREVEFFANGVYAGMTLVDPELLHKIEALPIERKLVYLHAPI